MESAVRGGERLERHLVLGHVGGRALLVGGREGGEPRLLQAALPEEVCATTDLHGSIARKPGRQPDVAGEERAQVHAFRAYPRESGASA